MSFGSKSSSLTHFFTSQSTLMSASVEVQTAPIASAGAPDATAADSVDPAAIAIRIEFRPVAAHSRFLLQALRCDADSLSPLLLCIRVLPSGGLELLFDRIKSRTLHLSPRALGVDASALTMRFLIDHLKNKYCTERHELFVTEDSVSDTQTHGYSCS